VRKPRRQTAADKDGGAYQSNIHLQRALLDIVDYSLRSVAEQIALKERFNAVLSEAIAGVATDDRIILDTGDGRP